MVDTGASEGFYEEDQPVADVVAAFEGGEQGLTRPPIVLDTAGLAAPDTYTSTYQAKVSVVEPDPVQIQPVVREVA